MQIVLTQSQTRFSQGGYVTINGEPQDDLGWLAAGNTDVMLYPRGETAVRIATDKQLRAWVLDWRRRRDQRCRRCGERLA